MKWVEKIPSKAAYTYSSRVPLTCSSMWAVLRVTSSLSDWLSMGSPGRTMWRAGDV